VDLDLPNGRAQFWAVVWFTLAVVGVAAMAGPRSISEQVSDAIAVGLLLVLGVRAVRSGVRADTDGLICRMNLRTVRLRWAEVASFESGHLGGLFARLRDGRRVRLQNYPLFYRRTDAVIEALESALRHYQEQ
jgi:hypothetical protein